MARFKVGDYVTIARLGTLSPAPQWGHMIGKTVKIEGVSENQSDVLYKVDHKAYDFWYEDELEPSKEHKVLEILRNYEKSRNNMG